MSVQHIHRTAIFTLHNPTRRVRTLLDQAMSHYGYAYSCLLHFFKDYTVDELHAMAIYRTGEHGEQFTDTKRLAKNLFDRKVPLFDAVLAPLESGLRESLKQEIASNLMSYVELSLMPDQTPSYPERLRKRDIEPFRLDALERLRILADDKEQEDEVIAHLMRSRQSDFMPLFFCRFDVDRNCGLFYNPETKIFYARLFVISPQSHHAKPLTMRGTYIDIRSGVAYARQEDANKEQGIESFGTGKRSILVPLEMGRWHEEALRFTETAFLPQRTGQTNAATPVSAHLTKDGDTYRLHVAFRFPKPERVKPLAYLGVDRGITCLAAGAVVSLDTREVYESFEFDGTELRTLQRNMEQMLATKQAKGKLTKGDRRRATVADQHVHLCANQIVVLAVKYQAQVVMEDLSAFAAPRRRPKGQVRSNFNKLLPRRQYQKVQNVVNAKLTLTGLPPIRLVSPSFTSLTCSQCGHISKESRNSEERTVFCCVNCQYTTHADRQAGINIARKVKWLDLRGEEKRRDVPDAQRTSWSSFITTLLTT